MILLNKIQNVISYYTVWFTIEKGGKESEREGERERFCRSVMPCEFCSIQYNCFCVVNSVSYYRFVFFLHSKHKMGRLTKNTRRFLLFRTNENKGKFINRSDYFLFYESYLKLATNILRFSYSIHSVEPLKSIDRRWYSIVWNIEFNDGVILLSKISSKGSMERIFLPNTPDVIFQNANWRSGQRID